MRKIVLFAMGLVLSSTTLAQEKLRVGEQSQEIKAEVTIAADLVSQYIWRGLDCGNVSIQPTLGIAYKGFSLSAWGNVGFKSEDTKEFDLTASYSTGGLTIGVTDYWFNTPEKRYFYYNAHSTSHVFEGFVSYDFGLLSAAWYTNFAGNDGQNKSGKRAYSSYFELNAPFKLATLDWTGTLGVVPYATTYYDTSGFAVTNVSLKASKDIRITDTFSVPIFAQVIGNPSSQKAYFVFGFTLKP
ncbi:MAG: hypothetical protein J5952_07390 [Prevotella sp.]|nr:hypothetical protein [Prevotella sp.]